MSSLPSYQPATHPSIYSAKVICARGIRDENLIIMLKKLTLNFIVLG